MITIRKTILSLSLRVLLLALSFEADAQQPEVYRTGVLTVHIQDRPHLQGVRDALKEAGYIEGKHLILNMLPGKNPDELRSIAKNYAEEKMDILLLPPVMPKR